MFQQFTIARTATQTYQQVMFNITNNIANAQTPAYKQTRAELSNIFPAVLQSAQLTAQNQIAEEDPYVKKRRGIELGLGVQIDTVSKSFSQGTLKVTDNEMDLAVEGDGFFQFRLNDGSVAYSRAGNLTKDSQGNLMSQSGYLLEPPITLPEGTTRMTVDQQGRVFATVNEDDVAREVGQILLARFPNPGALENMGRNLYKPTEGSGDPTVDVPAEGATGQVVQFAQENSNVDIIREMMEMVVVQRGLEMVGKAMNAGVAMMKAGMGMT